MKRLGLFVLLWSLAGAACGLKGTPVPPQALVPQRIEDLQALSQKERVVLSWAVPYKRRDGSSMGDLLGFEVFRKELASDEMVEQQAEPAEEDDVEGLTDSQRDLLRSLENGPRFRRQGDRLWEGRRADESPYTRVARILLDAPTPARLEDGVVTLVDEGVDLPSGFTYGSRYRYLVLSFNDKGLSGELSNGAEVLIVPPPRPPSDLVAVKGNTQVSLSWQSPSENMDGTPLTDLKGFNVYRSTRPGRYASTPINHRTVKESTFQDGGLENNETYYYVVRSVKGDPLTGQESENSDEVEAIPTDQTPPVKPQKVMGVRGEGFINLTWEPNRETDLQGYHVYRSHTPGSGYRRLTSSPILHTTYTDREAQAKRIYYYVVTAVDDASPPNESELSSEVKIGPR